jgi:CBS domain-containing protein
MTIPRTVKVFELMTRDVQTCGCADMVDRAAFIMWEHDCGCVPVLDGEGRVVGMVTDRDVCMAAYTQGRPLAMIPVATAMSQTVHACRPDDAVLVAERIMREHRIRRLPVIAADGTLAGILSLSDVAREAVREHAPATREVSAEGLAQTLAAVCEPRAR